MNTANRLDEKELIPRVTVSFRIFSITLDPEAITSMLGISPDHMHRVGEPRNNKSSSPYSNSMWLLKSTLSNTASLEEHLNNVCELLKPNADAIKQLAQTATVDFYCVVYDESAFLISANTLANMASLGATFGVTVHPPD